ncbi:MAG TPA: hypothetical protein PKC45_16860, partial [Gemmatales bacterium]|nr:hypothetical protein [Gemmatales bacterium]
EYHTYFTGQSTDGPWAVWAHNYTPQHLARSKATGKAAEAAARNWQASIGAHVVGEQVVVFTRLGKRVIDFLIRHKGKLWAMEVKGGNAALKSSQHLKDVEIAAGRATRGGLPFPATPTMPMYF